MRLFLVLGTALLASISWAKQHSFIRTYECLGDRCQRSKRPISADANNNHLDLQISEHRSLSACRISCLDSAGLWPIPTEHYSTGKSYVITSPRNFQFLNVNDKLSDSARVFISDAVEIFSTNLKLMCGWDCHDSESKVVVHIKVDTSSTKIDWNTNESYELEISSLGTDLTAFIEAQTVYGARHALETLSQLIAVIPVSNATNALVILDSAKISDKPVFKHRGLLIDTARNFLPVTDILRTIDALGSVKMNILHWHATDSQSWPLEIESVPQMAAYGAYGPEKIYSTQDMRTIVKYAKSRGVRVILEIDSPSHAGAGWEWSESEGLGNLAVCIGQQPWREYCIQPPCGQLNPVNRHTYEVLGKIYHDLIKIFGRNGVMHVGGDELFINCWNATEEITNSMLRRGMGRQTEDFLKLWAEFHRSQMEILNEKAQDKNGSVILWSSLLTSPEFIQNYLDREKFIVQTWVEADKELNRQLLDLGYRLIISTKDAWYLDHGFWGRTRYHGWREAYNNRIPQHKNIYGGEACMWGEYVVGGSLDSKVWPRTAAVAERLWSDPAKSNTMDAESRLQAHIGRLQQRKISSDAISPEWCNQNEKQCL